MPKVSRQEFEQLPLRVHDFLAGVPLHDVWTIDLPHPRSGITLDEFLQKATVRLCSLSPLARAPEHIGIWAPLQDFWCNFLSALRTQLLERRNRAVFGHR